MWHSALIRGIIQEWSLESLTRRRRSLTSLPHTAIARATSARRGEEAHALVLHELITARASRVIFPAGVLWLGPALFCALGGQGAALDAALLCLSFGGSLNYKGMIFSDVPNLASSFGYTNAPWTLKCDLTCEYVCRLINYMDRHGYRKCMPHNVDPSITELPSLDFSSGYVQRSVAKMPKQGSKRPWRLYQNYALDIVTLRFGKVDDGVMQYS